MLTRTKPQSHPPLFRRPAQAYALTKHPVRQPMVNMAWHTTGCHRFLLNNFKYFLTLFSKFFSSFPHGTCSLSVSRWYLALDEIYHPFRVAIPNNSTL